MTPDLKTRIEAEIQKHPVVIFMKGNPLFPRCGFSAVMRDLIAVFCSAVRPSLLYMCHWPQPWWCQCCPAAAAVALAASSAAPALENPAAAASSAPPVTRTPAVQLRFAVMIVAPSRSRMNPRRHPKPATIQRLSASTKMRAKLCGGVPGATPICEELSIEASFAQLCHSGRTS